MISQLPAGDVSENLLQDGAFRFATAGGAISGISQKLLGGYFDVPKDFSFIEGADKHVSVEILEESVAQILSLAYARARELPPIRTNGSVEEKSKVLTFKSSVAEFGGNSVFQ